MLPDRIIYFDNNDQQQTAYCQRLLACALNLERRLRKVLSRKSWISVDRFVPNSDHRRLSHTPLTSHVASIH